MPTLSIKKTGMVTASAYHFFMSDKPFSLDICQRFYCQTEEIILQFANNFRLNF